MHLEVFNEVVIMFTNYHLFAFTNFVNADTSYLMGYSLVFCIALVVAVNIAVMVHKSIVKFKTNKRLMAS